MSGSNTPNAGRLEAIWIKRAHKRPTESVQSGRLRAGFGLEGNVWSGNFRQVTLIEQEKWDVLMAFVGASADPGRRRANLMVSGIRLTDTRGRRLRIGSVEIEIAGETKPCEQMEAVSPGLQSAMSSSWGGGAFARVLGDGEIKVGDKVDWVS
jgi:MOSC domain-containing protein YiiM